MLTADPHHRVPHLAFQHDRLSADPILPISEVETAYYLRMTADVFPDILMKLEGTFGDIIPSMGGDSYETD